MSFLERCTEGAKHALALAQEAARAMGHNYVGSEHLLLGLIREGEGAAYKALTAFGVTASAVAERADALVGGGITTSPTASAIRRARRRSWS